ncbi:MAG TPA: hypothetical protein VJS65_03355, partial [Verrucomicrobiae bacterium]|nr:hypothetical protein [Verrucomicrobiae bacterium]
MLPPASVWTGVLLCFGAAIFPLTIAAQIIVPSGVETPVSGSRSGDQVAPAISADGDGGFIVWEDNTIENSKSNKGIAAVRLAPDLSSTGSPFQVNAVTAGDQEKPQTALLSSGRTLVTWESRLPAKPGLYGRLLSRDGSFASGEFTVSLEPSTSVTNFKQQVS